MNGNGDKRWYANFGKALLVIALVGCVGYAAARMGSNGHGKGDSRLGERVAHTEACIEQLTRGQDRIDGKLDRIIERLPPR